MEGPSILENIALHSIGGLVLAGLIWVICEKVSNND